MMNHERLFDSCAKSERKWRFHSLSSLSRYLFPLTGAAALAWFLWRIITKPSRINYPCMQIAAPIASSFIFYVTSLILSVLGLRKAYIAMKNHRYAALLAFALVVACALVLSGGGMNTELFAIDSSAGNGRFVAIDKPNTPIGKATGIFPGRVAWAYDPTASSWDGNSEYWWSDRFTNQQSVSGMLTAVVNNVAGKADVTASWDALFKDLNRRKGKGSIGYVTGEKIAIKVNLNSGGGSHGNKTDTSPQLVYALLDQLVHRVGVPQECITIYDAQRANISAISDHCSPEFPNAKYNKWGSWILDKLTFSSSEIQGSEVRRLPQAVVEADYLINVALLKRHSKLVDKWTDGAGQTGVTVCGKNHFGTCGKPDALHVAIRDWNRGMGFYNPIVDLISNKYLGGNTVLYIVDGLYGADYHFAFPQRWKMPPFNDRFPCSVFASQDILAIDSVCLDFLNNEWGLVGNADNYLHEAAQAEHPPSGTEYVSEGKRISSLGVHEHWNNAVDKQYSRNLKTGDGIELVQIGPRT